MKTEAKAVPGIILESWKPRSDEKYAVKLRVTYKKRNRTWILKYPKLDEPELKDLFGKTIAMTKKEFLQATGKKVTKKFNGLNLHFANLEFSAIEVIKKIEFFTFEAFEEKYFDKPKDEGDVLAAIETKAKALRKDEKINTAQIYEGLLSCLKEFTGKEKYPFTNITVSFLKKYEAWMSERTIGKKNPRKMSRTTMSIYMRSLKAVINESSPAGMVYPFGKGKYMIPKWNHNKRALTQGDVAKIAGYPAINGTLEHRSRDLWLFSFLCNGINFKDLANLKYSNIKGQTIVFERAKTVNRSDENGEITVVITRQLGRIIDRWGTGSGYIFDILKEGMTAEQQHRAIQQTIANTNKYMKRICAAKEIPEATTYTARHSFATVLKRSGASVEYISESLGHKNIKTTQNYLADFEIEEKKKWAEMLLPEAEE